MSKRIPTFAINIEVNNNIVYRVFKRAFDIFLSTFLILLLFPLMLVIGLIVIFTSKGPMFYVSDRVGRYGYTFKFLKFRSMNVNAEEQLIDLLKKNEVEGGVTFKMEDDPRITKFGKFIRRTSLDELPQLFNIFLGEMSFVGPRPCTVREFNLYDSRDQQRLAVKQGLTGEWQVNGRSNTTFKEMIEMDIEYCKKRSFWYDLKIMFKTIGVVFKHDGAK